jgi:hypothetical protein
VRYLSVCSGIEAATVACGKCGIVKPLDAFHKQPGTKNGRHSWCADCFNAYAREHRNRKVTPEQRIKNNLWTRYRIRPEEMAQVVAEQRGCCAICGGQWRLVVDHDHDTGKVRGILCHGCNIKLPAIEDAAFRAAALRYLRRAK